MSGDRTPAPRAPYRREARRAGGRGNVIAHCWCYAKGGPKGAKCGWSAEHRLASQLRLQAEAHRRAEHPWVARGKCHYLSLDALEYIADNQPPR